MKATRARSVTIATATAALVLAGATTIVAAPGAYDRPGTFERVSVASNGAQRDVSVIENVDTTPAVSADGRYVAFTSASSNLVQGDTNGVPDVFRRDRRTGRTVRVSVSSDGAQAIAAPLGWPTEGASISANGRFVAFHSNAINVVPGDTNLTYDVFVRDLRDGRTVRVSVASNGAQGNGYSQSAAISANGRYVAFESSSSNLVPGDTNDENEIFVHDLRTGTTVRAAMASGKTQANGSSRRASLSADGRYVAFQSRASNLVPGDDNWELDVFRHDLRKGKTVRVSVASDGTEASFAALPICAVGVPPLVTLPPPSPIRQGAGVSICGSNSFLGHSISADGRYVTFRSDATNLVPNDTNFSTATVGWDAFVHDTRTGRTERVSVDSYGRQRYDRVPFFAAVSGAGRSVVTSSTLSGSAEDCAAHPGELRRCLLGASSIWVSDVYDRVSGADESLAVSRSGRSPKPGPCTGVDQALGQDVSMTIAGSITPNGRYVALTSSGQDLVAGDTNKLCDVFVRDRGSALGVGGFGGAGSGPRSGGDTCLEGVCLPLLVATDTPRDARVEGADLIGGRAVPRPASRDLFVRLDVAHMPRVAGAPSGGLLYGLRFTASGERYEARVQRVPGADFDPKSGASFGLFRQDALTGLFTKVATLKGGYGTTGDSVVFAIPVQELGGGRLADVRGFTGVGSYLTGVTRVLDSVRLAM